MNDSFINSKGQEFSLEDISDLVNKDSGYDVFIGTDSHVHSSKGFRVKYVSCIALYKKTKGGRFFINYEFANPVNSIYERLSSEVFRSVALSIKFKDLIRSCSEITIDIDLNSNLPNKSAKYVQQLSGMVTGQGFKCRCKPDSWAASSVADKYSK